MQRFDQDDSDLTNRPEAISDIQGGMFTQPPSNQQPAGPFVPGSLEFYGTVQSVSAASIAVSMPDGQPLTLTVAPGQTDLSHNNNALPSQGQMINVHATAKSDGSFTANKLALADRASRHDLAEAEYRGATTSTVGSDLMLHFQVGTMAFSFPISATADLSDFDDRVQSIRANQPIEVEVEFQGTRGTIVEVDRR